MTAVKQLWISRVMFIVACVAIYTSLFIDPAAAALAFAGCLLMWLAANGRAVWESGAMDNAKRFDKEAKDAMTVVKGD